MDKLVLAKSELDFSFAKTLPEIKKLSDLNIIDCDGITSMLGLCYAVAKMTNLQNIYAYEFSEEQSLMLTCEAIAAAAKQGKDITVFSEYSGFEKLKIVTEDRTKTVSFHDNTYAKLLLDISQCSRTYADDIIAFVQKNLKGLKTFILEDN